MSGDEPRASGASVEQVIDDALWQKTLADFDSEERHIRFIEHFRTSGRLAEAARRYRAHRDEADLDEATNAMIDKRLAAIAIMAMAEMDGAKTDAKPFRTGRRIINIVVVVIFVLSVVALTRALLSFPQASP